MASLRAGPGGDRGRLCSGPGGGCAGGDAGGAGSRPRQVPFCKGGVLSRWRLRETGFRVSAGELSQVCSWEIIKTGFPAFFPPSFF